MMLSVSVRHSVRLRRRYWTEKAAGREAKRAAEEDGGGGEENGLVGVDLFRFCRVDAAECRLYGRRTALRLLIFCPLGGL